VTETPQNRAPAAAVEAAVLPGVLREGVTRSSLELFAAYGVELNLAEADAGSATFAAMGAKIAFLGFAGFGGPHLSGSVVLGATEGVLRRSNQTRSAVDDWMAELANQFLGRIKNRLLRAGIAIHRVPPTVVQGPAAALRSGRGGRPVALVDGHDAVLIWIDSETAVAAVDEVAFTEQADVMVEGEMVLF
jgi:hypothetical protein